ncbi:MAG: ATP-binding cassette domain-containing protein [Blastocatellales bacterium]
MVNTIFTVRGLNKSFAGRSVLHRVGFDVVEGEILCLIGPNGAGKTTLFECLAGLSSVDDGVIQHRNQDLNQSQRKGALFYLPDGITPWPVQTVKWALAFFTRLYTREKNLAQELQSQLKLNHLENSRIGSLSKGERKRLLLALGLLTTQPLLMLDEPFDGLDFRQTKDVMDLLNQHADGGRTLMLSVHQLADAARVCDRLVLLSEGRVVGEGTLRELCDQAKLNVSDEEREFLPERILEDIFLALT